MLPLSWVRANKVSLSTLSNRLRVVSCKVSLLGSRRGCSHIVVVVVLLNLRLLLLLAVVLGRLLLALLILLTAAGMV